MIKATFIAGLNAALGTSLDNQATPSQSQVRQYLQTLHDPARAIAVYNDYASSFYVHAAASAAVPGSDVTYASGTCNAWAEITSHRVLDHGRRVIDCEGFAWLANTLLGEAGFIPRGYRVLYMPSPTPGQQPTDWHIIVIMQFPIGSSSSSRRVYIGGPQVSSSLGQERRRAYPSNWVNAEVAPTAMTQGQAIQNMIDHASQVDTSDPAQLGPRPELRGPPVRAGQ